MVSSSQDLTSLSEAMLSLDIPTPQNNSHLQRLQSNFTFYGELWTILELTTEEKRIDLEERIFLKIYIFYNTRLE